MFRRRAHRSAGVTVRSGPRDGHRPHGRQSCAGSLRAVGQRIRSLRRFSSEIPEGPFDLIIFSEIGYYFSRDHLAALARDLSRTLDAARGRRTRRAVDLANAGACRNRNGTGRIRREAPGRCRGGPAGLVPNPRGISRRYWTRRAGRSITTRPTAHIARSNARSSAVISSSGRRLKSWTGLGARADRNCWRSMSSPPGNTPASPSISGSAMRRRTTRPSPKRSVPHHAGLEHNLGDFVLALLENLIAFRRILEAQTMADQKRGVEPAVRSVTNPTVDFTLSRMLSAVTP